MTAEGVYPKVAGDIAYASEANTFFNNRRLMLNKEYWLGSTSAGETMFGSSFIPAGSLANSCEFDGTMSLRSTGTPGAAGYKIVLSGAVNPAGPTDNVGWGFNEGLTVASIKAKSDFKFITGSPNPNGNPFREYILEESSTFRSANSFVNVSTVSGLWVYLLGMTNVGSTCYTFTLYRSNLQW